MSSPELPDSKPQQADFVLLVDDQPMVGEAIRRIVEPMDGFDYHYLSDPMEAMATIEAIKPSVVLLDLQMPRKDGLTLLAEIRRHPTLHGVPVVMLSGTESAQTKAQAFEAGTDDYLVKIPDRAELQARLRYHSRAFKTRMQRDEALQALRESQRKLQELNLQLMQLSQVDGLTGLANRRHFDETLVLELRRAHRNQVPLSLMMIDVDHFKRFNDNYGHQAGDRCLKQVADALKAACRRAGELAARYGGEEFALILPHCDAAGAVAVAEAIREAMRGMAIPHTGSVRSHVTVSIGLVTRPADARHEPEQLVELADQALYRAKQAGRDGHVQAHPGVDGAPAGGP